MNAVVEEALNSASTSLLVRSDDKYIDFVPLPPGDAGAADDALSTMFWDVDGTPAPSPIPVSVPACISAPAAHALDEWSPSPRVKKLLLSAHLAVLAAVEAVQCGQRAQTAHAAEQLRDMATAAAQEASKIRGLRNPDAALAAARLHVLVDFVNVYCGIPSVACSTCGKCNSLKVCGRCERAWYCGRECQVADWSRHGGKCVARAPVRQAASVARWMAALKRPLEDWMDMEQAEQEFASSHGNA